MSEDNRAAGSSALVTRRRIIRRVEKTAGETLSAVIVNRHFKGGRRVIVDDTMLFTACCPGKIQRESLVELID